MKKALTILLPIGILAAGGLLLAVMLMSGKPPELVAPVAFHPLVRLGELSPTNHRFVVRTQGTVTPRTEINLVAEVSGRIVAIAPVFTQGGFFEADDVLVTIDPRDYELVVVRSQAALAQAKTIRQREQAEAEIARSEWKNLGTGEPGALLMRIPQLAEADAIVASAEASLRIAERDRERCEITAPFVGRIRKKNVDVGQFVNKGEVVARVYAVDYIEVRVPLSLEEVGYLDLPVDYRGEASAQAGPRVTLRARIGRQSFKWAGRITRTEGEVDTRTRMITAVARVDDPYARSRDWRKPPLAIGLFVEAEIEGLAAEDVYLAPRSALNVQGDLLVVDGESRLRFRKIEVLRLDRDWVIFRQGVAEGDRVCLSNLEVVTDGMVVRVIDEDSPEDSRLVAGE